MNNARPAKVAPPEEGERSQEKPLISLNFLGRYLHITWLFAILLLVALTIVLPLFGFMLEDVQTVLFPIFLLAVYKLPKPSSFSFPMPLMLCALLLWGLGAMHVRAYAPSVINGHGMYISRLAADEDGLETRELYRRLNEISDHFSLEPAYVIQQGFSTNDEAFSWLHAHPEARVLIRGDAQWYDALVNKAVHLPELQHQTLPPFFTAAARALGFEDIAEFPVVRVSWLNEPFVLSGAPERIVLPGEPATLTRHFLALLGAGLAERDLEPAGEDEGTARIQERSARKHAFQAAAWIEGQWKNAHGLGAARALAATLSILDAVDMPPVLEERALHCAQVELHTAAGLAPHEEAPEVAAMIYNNIAVARILAGYRDYDFQKAFGWLSTASMMQTSDGSPVLGARLALLNLHMLWRSGLITPEMLRRRALPHEN